ncbi:MAG: NAD(P)-dependent oxidoreductase, partial [Parvularculales bacterium]
MGKCSKHSGLFQMIMQIYPCEWKTNDSVRGGRMMRAGVIGLGDMGSGLARNLIKAGIETTGLDLDRKRMSAFSEMGGKPAADAGEVGAASDAVYVMVMNGDQARSIILGTGGPDGGKDGLISSMARGGAVILTATIKPREAREIAAGMEGTGIALIDSPVSGGFPGAQGGTLTMMAAAPKDILDKFRPVMEAVSATIHHVGDEPGQGQTVKACLQSLIGSIFSATFEASVLAAKA